jgi:pSer/pThr/pTyr-binding forkhead associated (FHA) protein
MLMLIVTESPGSDPKTGQTFELTEAKPYLLGRYKKADIFIDDPNVSRQHLRFIPRPGKWTIKNLADVGTSVNGQLLEGEQVIQEGDKIKVGGFCFVTTKVGIPRPDKDETWELDDK